jgi:hypothetical protein
MLPTIFNDKGEKVITPKTVKRIRKDFRISQLKLAGLSGLSRFRLCLYENKYLKLSMSELEKLGAALQKIRVSK